MFPQKELMHRARIQEDEELTSADLRVWKWSDGAVAARDSPFPVEKPTGEC